MTTASRLSETDFAFRPSGERFVFRTDPFDADRLGFDFHLAPGGGVPLVHCHLRQVEVFRCVSGVLDVTVNGEFRQLRAGEELDLEPGTFHSLANTGEVDVVCGVEYRPAGRNREWLHLNAAFIDRMGREPGLLDLAPFLPDVDIYVLRPPLALQRVVVRWVMRPLGILLGRRRRMLRFASEAFGRSFTW